MHWRQAVFAALALAALPACRSDLAVVGSYSHPEHGTIILGDDGNGTWRQGHVDIDIDRWDSQDSTDVTFTTETGQAYEAVVHQGVLVLSPGQGLGDEPVSFDLMVQLREDHPESEPEGAGQSVPDVLLAQEQIEREGQNNGGDD
ncbi:hypothetical protein [Ornithinicoccus halotolerans]|uniref:hypothetical protein n=1 Tax=Ornithinicoccus halotolerans TaxID=1748220 RepID=UPI00188642AA|nr:hypothetical protein [Ornithinicoccus halotolerans]